MRKYLLLLLVLLTLACNKRGDEPTAEKAYAMLERVAEQNALGNKPAALALADSALALNPADTTRCWLMSEKAVTLVDMGRMADAVGVAQGAYALARKLHDVEAMLNLRGTMGIAYRRQGMTDSALVQYKEGIDMALAEQNTEYEIYLNNCVTVLYSESNRFDEALHYARKTEEAAAAANDTIQRLSARANIGGIYMRQNNYKAALHALLPCWPEVKKVGYNVLTLKFLSVILKSYSSLADYQAVDKYMRYADRVMASMATNSNGVLGILEVKAHLLGAQHRYNEQLTLIDSIMASGALNQAMPLEKMLRMKALCLEKMNRKAEALTLMNRAFNLLDSVKQSDIEKSMTEFSVRYKTLETEKALAEQKQQTAEKANQVLWLVVAVLAGVLVLMLYKRRIAAQRALLHEKQSYIDGLENERERIAKELHDGVCNDILASKLLLATDSRQAETYLNDVWRNVRQLSHELMPPSFENVTLDTAVRSYVATVGNNAQNNVKLHIDNTFAWQLLPQRVAYETYRIIQEAMGNAIKHGSGHIDISLTVKDDNLRVSIVNAIKPISANTPADSPKQPHGSGIGLQTLQKRADHIGAKLTVEAVGTHHTLTLTLKLHTEKSTVKQAQQ
jgi:two-component system NarL family sensor kinase